MLTLCSKLKGEVYDKRMSSESLGECREHKMFSAATSCWGSSQVKTR